jgi:hypothetical protein
MVVRFDLRQGIPISAAGDRRRVGPCAGTLRRLKSGNDYRVVRQASQLLFAHEVPPRDGNFGRKASCLQGPWLPQ